MSAACPVFGFIVTITPRTAVSAPRSQVVAKDLMVLLEHHGLVTSGRGDPDMAFTISRDGAQATHADRELVMEWASRWTDVVSIRVSDLVDLSQSA